jgi:16S rRNA processing protein RimM
MAYQKHILVGRITRIHGFGGAVTVKTERVFSENIPEMETVFLEIEGKPVPFFIEYTEQAGPDILRMKFEGYDNDTKVREFIGCSVYLTDNRSPGNLVENDQNLLEYKLLSSENEHIGIIEEIIHNPGQILLCVRSASGKKILIPLHKDLIKGIDPNQKILKMFLPEGLTKINQ